MIIAFICGLVATWVKQPPLVGFLAAGFLLNAFGVGISEFLRITADLGITLLLFTLGLKLQVRSLFNPQVWGVASIHLILVTLGLSGFVALLSWGFSSYIDPLDLKTALLIGFALTFSSTVFAVKILDEMGANTTLHGKISIGVLIIQDIAAVAFVAASAGKLPSPWALALLLIIPLRHFFQFLLERCGHGELLILFGITLAVGGADLFELVDMKGDLGALLVGMVFSGHPKSEELAKGLLEFKNLFLVGFFLTVGMTALPGWKELMIALSILVLLPLKTLLYFVLFSLFRLRARTSWQSSLNLANFSEFGLIVGAIAVSNNWLPAAWLAIFAILLALSFMISAPMASHGDEIYTRFAKVLRRFDRDPDNPVTQPITIPESKIAIFGMGRVGSSIFDGLSEELGSKVLGIDSDEEKVHEHVKNGRTVLLGDGMNPDFWSASSHLLSNIEWIVLALPSHQTNCLIAQRLTELSFTGKIAATARYSDEVLPLQEVGVEFVFDIHSEAGRGFASDFLKRLPSASSAILPIKN
ncbi:MAG: cation:proton antiporter [Pseudobacteriovorax sp.]|nr:cation:proton antiporter [Pseudobacteriovorax sp.]